MFGRVLVANRGEIAVRIIRALREMKIRSIAVFSDADRGALHVRMADEAEHIGPAPSADSYLRVDRILEAARKHRAEAIHPGYGFLSENAGFAAACAEAGIVFIGPSAESIRRLGSKTAARILAKQAGAPVVPGSEEAATNIEQARALARQIGYPVLLKAAAGGGGKGMRFVREESHLESSIRDASSEAERAFQNGEIYIEKVIERPRHIEIQIAGRSLREPGALGPARMLTPAAASEGHRGVPVAFVARHPEMRAAMGEAALKIARAAGYDNLGTVEFLTDQQGNFYFLEVNTRLQVEHPVTELVTGYDLVQLQLRIAAGEGLPFTQKDIQWRGWAMECRVSAEDPDNQFFPSAGRIDQLHEPSGPAVRLDSGIYPGGRCRWNMIHCSPAGNLGPGQERCRSAPVACASEYAIAGIQTNIAFFREILNDPEFLAGNLSTEFIADFLARRKPRAEPSPDLDVAVALAALAHFERGRKRTARALKADASRWLTAGRGRLLR